MIRTARPSDLPAIRRLWAECFPGDAVFDDYFFAHIFRTEYTALLLKDGKPAAMLQMLPYDLRIGAQTAEATYIYGACTAVRARRQGLMAQLLAWSFEQDRRAGRVASVLIPQEEWLFGFYARFGYRPAFYTRETQNILPCSAVGPLRRCTSSDTAALQAVYRQATARQPLLLLRSDAQWQAQIHMFDALGGGVYALESNGCMTAYAFLWQTPQEIWAQELLAVHPQAAQQLCQSLAAHFPGLSLRITAQGHVRPLGCAKFYGEEPDADGYFNLLYQ